MLVIVGGCVIVMNVAVVARATAGWPDHAGARLAALAGSALVPLGLLVWLPSGPLAAGWAKTAGTPASLLKASATSGSTSSSSSSSGSGAASSSAPSSFNAQVSGTVAQGPLADGLYRVDIRLTATGQKLSALGIRLRGQPLQGGGIQMTSSRVTLGTRANPGMYSGQVTSLQGTNIGAQVHDGSGRTLRLAFQLQIDSANGSAAGTVSATG
jgi:hypothetical protein